MTIEVGAEHRRARRSVPAWSARITVHPSEAIRSEHSRPISVPPR